MIFQTLDNVVREICILDDDPEFLGYSRVLVAAAHSVDDLNCFTFPMSVRAREYTLGADLSLPFPEDAAVIISAGACHGRDIILFGYNDHVEGCTCSGEEKCDVCYWNIEGIGENYAAETCRFGNGKYNIDYKNRRLYFFSGSDAKPGSHVVIKYRSTNEDTKYRLIPREAFKFIRNSVKEYMQDNVNEAAWNRNIALAERKRLQALYSPWTLTDIINALQGHPPIK